MVVAATHAWCFPWWQARTSPSCPISRVDQQGQGKVHQSCHRLSQRLENLVSKDSVRRHLTKKVDFWARKRQKLTKLQKYRKRLRYVIPTQQSWNASFFPMNVLCNCFLTFIPVIDRIIEFTLNVMKKLSRLSMTVKASAHSMVWLRCKLQGRYSINGLDLVKTLLSNYLS